MSIRNRFSEQQLPYDADVFCIKCREHLRVPIKFKTYIFIDAYFEFLKANTIYVLGYLSIPQSSYSDIIYIAYKPLHCDRNLLISETKRFFKNWYRKNVIIIDVNCRRNLPNTIKYKLLQNYEFQGFTIRRNGVRKKFRDYLLHVLHLSEEYADIHVQNMDIIGDYKWKSKNPSTNVFKEYPSDIDNYVTSLYAVDCDDKDREKELKKALTLYLRFLEYQRESQSQAKVVARPLDEVSEKKRISIPTENENDTKKIRIDIVMDDIDDFLDYLERRIPERQRRKRYYETIKMLYESGWNEHKHSTFIDGNKYKVNTKDIEIFVNGMKNRDFSVSVKEYEESIELYLSYLNSKKYISLGLQEKKEDSIPPVVKVRERVTMPHRQNPQEGKRIFATIQHLESWKSERTSKNDVSTLQPTTKYFGESVGERKSKSLKSASITNEKESVNITFNLNKKEQVSHRHTDSRIQIPRSTLLLRILDFLRRILKCRWVR